MLSQLQVVVFFSGTYSHQYFWKIYWKKKLKCLVKSFCNCSITLSHVMRKPVYAICEQQRHISACASSRSDQRLCFRCLDTIIPLVSISEISSLYLASVAAQAGLSLTWSQTPNTGFLVIVLVWWTRVYKMSRRMTKPTKWPVRPAKTQISLGIRPVWSEHSRCAQWVAKDSRFPQVDSQDSDQTGRILVLSCCGSNYYEWITMSCMLLFSVISSQRKRFKLRQIEIFNCLTPIWFIEIFL